ncbi:MAG: 3-deoxy-manno-octulosonate cytidylyltransferase [Stellaceae bacterium]
MPSSTPLIVIPARMGSTRLPGKPLADIHGAPMIVHVWRRAIEAETGPVVVACAEREIADAVQRAGGTAVLTRADHPAGSDRVHEAATQIDPRGQHDVIVNLQGDLPTLDPAALRAALAPLVDPAVEIATLAAPMREAWERDSTAAVKIAVSFAPGERIGRALYFSRSLIPSGEGPHYHHIGLYAFRRAALERFVALPPSPLELREKLEQLRALEAGMRIDVALVDAVPMGVDTPDDLERASAILAKP